MWCDDKSGTAFVDYVAFGVDWGFGYGGTFRASEAGGIYKNSYLTATGTRRHGWATDKTSLLVPKGSNEAEGHADMGVYCLMSGSSYSEVDYSDLVVKETGDYDLYALRLLYVAEAEKWILIYAFESSSGGADPTFLHSGIQLLRPRKIRRGAKSMSRRGGISRPRRRPTGPWRWVIPSPSQAGCFQLLCMTGRRPTSRFWDQRSVYLHYAQLSARRPTPTAFCPALCLLLPIRLFAHE